MLASRATKLDIVQTRNLCVSTCNCSWKSPFSSNDAIMPLYDRHKKQLACLSRRHLPRKAKGFARNETSVEWCKTHTHTQTYMKRRYVLE